AVLLAVNRGGSRTFIYLGAVLNQGGQPSQAGVVYIDDRPVTKRLEIKEGLIEYDVVVHQANDPMVSPSLAESQMYRLEGGTLLLTRLESQTTNGQTRKIVIDSPRNGDLAGGVVQVQGSMPIGPFENNLAYRLYDAAGNQIDAQPFGVQAPDMGAPATFDNPVSLPALPKGTVVWLELAELSMADGAPLAVPRVQMVVGEP
nr:Gmad2 immunoglobulin-like domain-containing protein [Anaerolinea sp.]